MANFVVFVLLQRQLTKTKIPLARQRTNYLTLFRGDGMHLRRLAVVFAFLGISFCTELLGQGYPVKTIRMIVPVAPGGGADLVARMVADKVQGRWGQPVIIENRPPGNVGADAVAKSAADGYTFLFTPPGPLVINKSLYRELSYDPDAFEPVSIVTTSLNILLVHPTGAASIQQLIANAKANPGNLNYASGGSGGTPHLTAELFNSMAGVKVVHVPYKSNPPALTALLAGQVDLMFGELSAALPHLQGGKLRVLAVGSEKRNVLMPNVPSVAEVLPGFVSQLWYGIVAPAGTPATITQHYSASVSGAVKQPDVAKKLLDSSVEAVGSTPAEMAAILKQERARWGKVIRDTGATAN